MSCCNGITTREVRYEKNLSVGLLNCALLLGACNKANPSDNGGAAVSHTVTKEQYDKAITNYGFALNNNVTYSGTFSVGAMSMSGIVEIDNNVLHTKANGDYGFESFVRIDANTIKFLEPKKDLPKDAELIDEPAPEEGKNLDAIDVTDDDLPF